MPSPHCCVRTCRNQRGKGVHLFGFPMKNYPLLKKWVAAIDQDEFYPTKYSTICSKHFTPDDFQNRPAPLAVRVKKEAVPSVFDKTKKRALPRQSELPRLDRTMIVKREALEVDEDVKPPKAMRYYTDEIVKLEAPKVKVEYSPSSSSEVEIILDMDEAELLNEGLWKKRKRKKKIYSICERAIN
ncbi:THAP domain-containing protein 1-like isoform X1 [Athalia rosae]|uniref:THAP domain-containing protein 1-like isoform X1 n=2 Tax=Athalia rosae TaxID=37344 RepID=UPI0020340680|nr:THAP domain-containing protein 1-like isoform X1 [Athalia rosae]